MSEFERNDMFEENDDYGADSYEGGASDKGKSGRGVKKPRKKTSGKKVEGKLTVAFVALALMFVTFVVLVVLENKMVNSGEKVQVVVATAEVPAGMELTQTNMPNYFAIEERNKEDLPVGVTVYNNGNPMIGKVTDRVIHAKEVITNECFHEGSFFEGVEDAVELSIDLGAIGQTVGGTLRPGDKVDIKAVIKIDKQSLFGSLEGADGLLDVDDEAGGLLDYENVDTIEPVEGEIVEEEPVVDENGNTISSKDAIMLSQNGMLNFATDVEVSFGITGDYVSQVIAEDITVVQVFNSGGETLSTVEAAGGNMVATVINVAVPANLVDAILIAQAEGTLTLSRVVGDEELVEDNTPVEGELPITPAPADGAATTTPADGTVEPTNAPATTDATPAPSEVPAQ